MHTEPPLTLGRGLMITTGAIGGLLSLALLWAMLPSAGRGGLSSPTVVSSTSNDSGGRFGSTRAETLVASSVPRPATTAVSSSLVASSPPVQPQAITTAHAVEGHSSVAVRGAKGYRHDVNVVMVDHDLGLAVLGPEAGSLVESYTVGATPLAGDPVTVLGKTATQATVLVGEDGRLTLDGWTDDVPEGAPVINANGELVGVCTQTADGPVLVAVDKLGSLRNATTTTTNAPGPWLAVHVVDSGAGPAVDGVDPNGPAGTAGIVVGDTITAVNGKPVTTLDELKALIAAHFPGDTVTVSVVRADQTTTDVSVTLGTAPSM
jgi:hypothetical protein